MTLTTLATTATPSRCASSRLVATRRGRGRSVTLEPNRNAITVEVTAEDGTTKRVYTITVTRLTSEGPEDASLVTLTLTDDTDNAATVKLVPAFSRLRTSYTASVAFEVDQVTVAATRNAAGERA